MAVVQYLIDRGVDIHAGNEAALRFACSILNGNLDLIIFLVKNGAKFNKKIWTIYCEKISHDIYSYIDYRERNQLRHSAIRKN
jgi:hypothetical protein